MKSHNRSKKYAALCCAVLALVATAPVLAGSPLLTTSEAISVVGRGSPTWNPNPSAMQLGKAVKEAGTETYKGLKPALDALKQQKEYYDTLTAGDKRTEPDYQPPGQPSVPSKCMEDKACRPCFTEAYEKVNKSRKLLEKVRAHYEFTHKFTRQGKAFMQGIAGAGGGIAALGAQYEVQKVDGALAEFDKVVRDKNQELLASLEKNLRGVNVCEAKFYKNEDWYDRYGYTYYQFMLAHYDYVPKAE